MLLRSFLTILLVCASGARAGDGAIELSRDMLPLTITTGGHYIATENLVGVPGTNGITVAASQVVLDLNGFALTGVPGSLHGVYAPGPIINLTIANGTIEGWGEMGVSAFAASNSTFRALVVQGNGTTGVWCGVGAVVEGCSFIRNGWVGIEAENGTVFRGCTAAFNADHGFDVHSGSVLLDCIATGNSHDGFHISHSSVVEHCTAEGNGAGVGGGAGFEVDTGSTVKDCVSRANGDDGYKSNGQSQIIRCVAEYNADDGIAVNSDMTVRDCISRFNVDKGIQVLDRSSIIGCVTHDNGDGDSSADAGLRAEGTGNYLADNVSYRNIRQGIRVQSTGNILLNNVAYSNSVNNFLIDAGNQGQVVVSPGATLPNNPWVNFSL